MEYLTTNTTDSWLVVYNTIPDLGDPEVRYSLYGNDIRQDLENNLGVDSDSNSDSDITDTEGNLPTGNSPPDEEGKEDPPDTDHQTAGSGLIDPQRRSEIIHNFLQGEQTSHDSEEEEAAEEDLSKSFNQLTPIKANPLFDILEIPEGTRLKYIILLEAL